MFLEFHYHCKIIHEEIFRFMFHSLEEIPFGDNIFGTIESNFLLILRDIATSLSNETLYAHMRKFQKQPSRASIK